MARQSLDLQKVTVNLRHGDFDYLHTIAQPNGVTGSILLRSIVAREVDRLRAKEAPINPKDLE